MSIPTFYSIEYELFYNHENIVAYNNISETDRAPLKEWVYMNKFQDSMSDSFDRLNNNHNILYNFINIMFVNFHAAVTFEYCSFC